MKIYRVNPKPTRAKKHKTAADKSRFAKLKRMGCCICGMFYKTKTQPEIHHIETSMGRRKNHRRTIPLCPRHHQTDYLSVHVSKKFFEHIFGTESELLAKVNALLEKM